MFPKGRLDRCLGFLCPRDVTQPDNTPKKREGERENLQLNSVTASRGEFTWLIFLASSHINALTYA